MLVLAGIQVKVNAIMMEILQTFLKKIKNRANKQQTQGISSVCPRDVITHPPTAVSMESEQMAIGRCVGFGGYFLDIKA